jgi:hypothetical protein
VVWCSLIVMFKGNVSVLMFVASIMFLIISPNAISVLFGRDG